MFASSNILWSQKKVQPQHLSINKSILLCKSILITYHTKSSSFSHSMLCVVFLAKKQTPNYVYFLYVKVAKFQIPCLVVQLCVLFCHRAMTCDQSALTLILYLHWQLDWFIGKPHWGSFLQGQHHDRRYRYMYRTTQMQCCTGAHKWIAKFRHQLLLRASIPQETGWILTNEITPLTFYSSLAISFHLSSINIQYLQLCRC